MSHLRSRLVFATIAALVAPYAQAQLIEEVELRRDGRNAIASVRFVSPVQYLRSTASRNGDLVQSFYDVLPTRDVLNLAAGQQRTVHGGGTIPQIQIEDEAQGRAGMSRKLIIRFAKPVKFVVRAGRGNRAIEIVLDGMGESVEAANGNQALAIARSRQVAPAPEPQAIPSDTSTELTIKSAALWAEAQAAFGQSNFALAIEKLNELLALPATPASRRAQEMIGLARLKQGDTSRARGEFENFLQLYPSGPDSDRIRTELAALPKPSETPRARPAVPPTSTTTGSLAASYYGGRSKVRTQEFQDSPLSGLPELASDNVLSGTDQKQALVSTDLNWRYRDADKDMRFVFRDSYSADLRTAGRNKNRLSALYFDYKSTADNYNFRVGRQSPTGGGVLYRFDGLQAGYTFAPKWRANAVVGSPTDTLLDTQRHFYGLSLDAEALTKELSGSAYVVQQMIDKQVDRRALGTELRYFSGGLSVSSQLDYDVVIKGLNIASLQGTLQLEDNTVFNMLLDRRTVPVLGLSNVLFFQNPAMLTPARRLSDLFASGSTLADLRTTTKAVTAYQNQGLLGFTTPINKNWQAGADIRWTNVGAIAAVPVVLPNGQPGTGNLWGVGTQLIGSNLYSGRDTHVFSLNLMKGPTYQGNLFAYNNMTSIAEVWQLEPSFKYYTQSGTVGGTVKRWTPGVRLSLKIQNQFTVESEVVYERSETKSPSRNESSGRLSYFLGARYDY
jgi:tetratricopeptide (TPR) repeat protein